MPASDPKTAPAWREPMVWLVAGGPAVVVVASCFTLSLALRHPDPPLDLHVTAQRAADDTEPADMRGKWHQRVRADLSDRARYLPPDFRRLAHQ